MARPFVTRTYRYGPSPGQEGDLCVPAGDARTPVIVLLHGGFWRMPYGREETARAAEELARRGFAVWNLEYRRVGEPGGGWPGTLQDVAAGIDHLAVLAAGAPLDLARVIVAGHSAGGHLALWAAGRAHGDASPFPPPRVRAMAAFGLAPVADLAAAFAAGAGRGAVAELLGGSPAEVPERYRAASPMELLPLGIPQVLLHGTADEAVSIEPSRGYADAARAAGDRVVLLEVAGAGHMDHVDPASAAFATFGRALGAVVRGEPVAP